MSYLLGHAVRRFGYSLLVLLGVFTIVFALTRVSGDPIDILLPLDATAEQRQQVRELYGLDHPLPVQYVHYLRQAVQGDFGESLQFRDSALELVLSRIPATAMLTAGALLVALLIAVPAAYLSALRPGGLADVMGGLGALLGQAMPGFWLGLLLIMLLSVRVPIFPTSGSGTIAHLVLPSITLSALTTALIYRVLRASLTEELTEDYVRTARAKGLRPARVIAIHATRGALIPVVTIFGLQVGQLFAGAIVVETVFAYPGLGRLAITAILNRDFPVVQAFVVVVAAIVLLVNYLTDLTYAALDPRIREV